MNPNEGKVVMFTNITNKDFTHAWGGQPFSIKAGETVAFPYDLGLHLATHLSRRIFLDEDTSPTEYDPKHPDTRNGVGKPLWNDESERAMIAKILGQTFQEELPVKKSELEILKEQVEALQSKFGGSEAEPSAIIPLDNQTGEYKDKAEVIAELEKLGIKFDARQTKAKLVELLKSAPTQE